MTLKIYNKKGYLAMDKIIETGYPFIFVPAARGTGKTYGTLKDLFLKGEKIIQLRRTQNEVDMQNSEKGSSYGTIMRDLGKDFSIVKQNKIGHVIVDDETICYNLALSTFANVRGIDFNEINYIVYDEFIAEPHVRKIKAEGMALANIYETVNRNRELQGRPPVVLVCLANSVNMANDVFLYFDLITHAEEMINKKEEIRVIGNKLLIIPQSSPISEKKSHTALYQAVNSEFSEMAINNKFVLNDFQYVKKQNLQEYRCMVQLGDLYIYEHKSGNQYYVTFQKGQTKNIYGNGYADRTKAKRSEWNHVIHYLDGIMLFESYRCIALFEKYFDL